MKRLVEGYVDGARGARLRGWAWNPNRPDQPVTIEVWRAGRLLARAPADQFRADLETAGKRGGACAFDVLVDEGGEVVVRTAKEDGAVELPGGRLRLEPEPRPAGASAPVTAEGWLGGIDRLGPARLSGWVRSSVRPSPRPVLELHADGAPVLRFTADLWRKDLEELSQGDGRWGFDAPLPAVVRDGAAHKFDLRLADDGPSLIDQPLWVALPPAGGSAGDAAGAPSPAPEPSQRRSPPPTGPPELSILVNFYNMAREAERTLTSLSRSYQRGIDDLAYEVICIDNGSAPPLDPDWIAGFGPEFTLFRPEHPRPSPCPAINAAAQTARGQHLAVMIDGAHVLTPGAMAEALRHLRCNPPAVVALRHWFIGGDQRWLSASGYAREQEDVLFDRIGWPTDGYKLYRIGAPIGESPNSWFDGLSESNCLFMPASVWRAIGGFDEAFVQPGGGLANLDLLRRAAAAAPDAVVCLIGEATFHQYHGGTTTNIDDAEKDIRVARYDQEYAKLRGKPFEPLGFQEFRLAGRIPDVFAYNIGQRPMYPARLGVTEKVRPASLQTRLDYAGDSYLPGAYAELGLHEATRWAGEPVGIGSADLIALQELIHAIRPTAIVTTSANPALLGFVDSMCQLAELGATPIILASEAPVEGAPHRVNRIEGSPWAAETLPRIDLRIADAEEVLVLFEAPDEPGAPFEALRAYAGFVSYGSYIVYLNTALGQPYLGYSNRWPMKAIRTLTEGGVRYAVDRSFSHAMASTCPNGYIQRVGGLIEVANDLAELDDLETIDRVVALE
jgi:cephalosporin hydroxylase